MSEQLSFLQPAEPPIVGAERFAECRVRIAAGCGGHHELGPLFASLPINLWVCCNDCPNRAELNPGAA